MILISDCIERVQGRILGMCTRGRRWLLLSSAAMVAARSLLSPQLAAAAPVPAAPRVGNCPDCIGEVRCAHAICSHPCMVKSLSSVLAADRRMQCVRSWRCCSHILIFWRRDECYEYSSLGMCCQRTPAQYAQRRGEAICRTPHERNSFRVVQVESTLNVCSEGASSCVSTSNDDEAHFLPPWSYDGPRETAIAHLISISTGAANTSIFSLHLWPRLQLFRVSVVSHTRRPAAPVNTTLNT